MRPLLALSNAIDLLNQKLGVICNFLILAACVVSGAPDARLLTLAMRLSMPRAISAVPRAAPELVPRGHGELSAARVAGESG